MSKKNYTGWAVLPDGRFVRARTYLGGMFTGNYGDSASDSGTVHFDNTDYLASAGSPTPFTTLIREYNPELYAQLSGLNSNQWGDLLDQYATPSGKEVDMSLLQSDIDSMLDALANYNNEMPLLENYLADARAQIAAENAAEFAEMDRLLGQQQDLYNAELKGLGDSYDLARSNLLSQQYQQNSQLMDTLQSGMERSRRNALEAGASAGIRIADNINTLLSVQNKQSATSMETANQLSQMMINQRNAEAATRRDYSSYLQADNAQRSNLRLSANDRANSLANTNYQAADQAYLKKEQDFADDNQWNPLYGYRSQLKNKSKYSTGGNE